MSYTTTFTPISSENVVTGAVTAQSTNAPGGVRAVRVFARNGDMFVKAGGLASGSATLTATTDDIFFSAGHVEYFNINEGEPVAAIQDSAAGIMNLTWMRERA